LTWTNTTKCLEGRKLPDIAVAQCGLSSLDEDEKDIGNRVKHVMKLGSRGILLMFLVDLTTMDSEFTSDLSTVY